MRHCRNVEIVFTCVLTVGLGLSARTAPLNIDGGRQLFVDDALIAVTNGIVRSWNALTKHPAPVLCPDPGVVPGTNRVLDERENPHGRSLDSWSVWPDYTAANPYAHWRMLISAPGGNTTDTMYSSTNGRAFVCPACGYAAYPKLSSAVIVLESGWFRRGCLPEIPRKGSIARALLDAWDAGRI